MQQVVLLIRLFLCQQFQAYSGVLTFRVFGLALSLVAQHSVHPNAREASIGWVLVREGALERGGVGTFAHHHVVRLARPLRLQCHDRPVGWGFAWLQALEIFTQFHLCVHL